MTGWTEHSYARRQIRSSLTKKLYCLSDIVNGVQKSFLAREHRKNERRKNKIALDFKDKLTATEDPKNDVRITKDSRENDKTTEKSKDEVIFIIDLQNNVNDKKDSKHDMKTAKDDSGGDANVSKNPLSLSKEPKDYVVDMKDTKNDVTAVDGFIKKRNDVIGTDNMEIDVTTNDDVKDPIDVVVTTDRANDVSEAQDSNNVNSNDSNKMNEKIITHKRGLKRKRDVTDNVNRYKGRLRVRRNKIQIAIRRKYRRRKPLKNAAASSESVQPDSTNTPNNPTKKKKMEVDKVLQTDCDLIEQSIIEIVRYTSGYSVNVNKPGSDLGSERLKSEGAESGTSNASTGGIENPSTSFSSTSPEVSHPRFIDEKFVKMNIPFQNVAEVDKKESRKSKSVGSVEREHPVSRRKRPKVLHAVVTSEISSHRPVVAQMRSPSSNRSTTVSSVYLSSSSLTNVFEAGREAIQTKSHVSNTENIGKMNSRNQVDENSSLKTWSSPNLTSSIHSSFSSGKYSFPPKNRTQKSLNEIVNCMNSPNKVEVPLTSTVSMMHWSTILSKGSEKVTETSMDTQENDLSGNGTPLNTEQIAGLNCANDVEADCSESKSSVFGHVKDAFSIAGMPQTSSIEPASQGGSQLSSVRTHNSKTLGSRKGEAVKKTKNTCETGTNTIKPELSIQTPEQTRTVTEVPASYVDLSWRIVTSNDGHSSSLSNFFKLVPITIARGPSGTLDAQEPTSFLGVPIHGGPAVIAKILNTSCAQNCNEIFQVTRRPNIETAGTYVKKSTLSFVWDGDAVLVNSESLKEGNLSGKDVKPRPPIWIDMCNRVSIVLPKPLRLPEAGNVIYLGDFNVKVNCVEFVVTHSVEVTRSPRPSLTVPSGTPVNSNSTVSQAIRCRSPGKAKKDVQASRKVAVGRKTSKGNRKTFQKCVFCGIDLKCQKDVKMHRKLHATFAGTKCSECKRRFHNGGRLSVHLDTHKCNWLHICGVCKKSYRTPKFLTPIDLAKDYYKMCLPCRRKELKCKKCTERSLTFEDLEVHLKEKHGLYCPICKCSFFFKRDLLKHMNIQHGILGVPPPSSTTKS